MHDCAHVMQSAYQSVPPSSDIQDQDDAADPAPVDAGRAMHDSRMTQKRERAPFASLDTSLKERDVELGQWDRLWAYVESCCLWRHVAFEKYG